MGIHCDKLVAWARTGLQEKSKQTYGRFKEIIEQEFGGSAEVFLQGSYRNHTNVRDNSDIDIVILFKDIVVNHSVFFANMINNSNNTQFGLNSFAQLRNKVMQKLNGKYGFNLELGTKC